MSLATLKVEENIISLELVGAWNTVSGLGLGPLPTSPPLTCTSFHSLKE